jgi:hypothetical protein
VFATDGDMLEVEELSTGEAVACKYVALPKHFGLLLPLAGISSVRQIKDNPIDIQATNRLNKLHLELLKENPDWEAEARRADLNQFMARLIFCFFADAGHVWIAQSGFEKNDLLAVQSFRYQIRLPSENFSDQRLVPDQLGIVRGHPHKAARISRSRAASFPLNILQLLVAFWKAVCLLSS